MRRLLMVGICCLLFAAPAAAGTVTWSSTPVDGNWNNASNWVGGLPQNGDDLVFPATSSIRNTTNNIVGLQVNSITFAGNGYTLAGNAVTLAAAGINCTTTASPQVNTVSLNVVLAATATIDLVTGCQLSLDGLVSGAFGFTKSGGGGPMIVSGNNTFTGAVTVSNGGVFLANLNGLGTADGTAPTGTTVSPGGQLQLQVPGTYPNERLVLAGGTGAPGSITGSFSSSVSAPGPTWSGPIVLTANSQTGGIDMTISGVISGSFGLTKLNAGTLTLTAVNTYTGVTTVAAGTLAISGVVPGDVTAQSGTTLKGTGTIGGLVTASSATVAPGLSPGILNTGQLNLASGALSVELDGPTAGTGYDQVNVTGTVTLTGATLTRTLGFTPSAGAAFTLVENDGADSVIGTFAGLPQGTSFLVGTTTLTISYVGGTGNDVVLTVTATGVTPVDPLNIGADNMVRAFAVQPDGKVIVGGGFGAFNGVVRRGLARLNIDGSLDAAFNPDPSAGADIYAVALQRDGKIVIGGSFVTVGGVARSGLARLNADGSLDLAFNPGTDQGVFALAVQADDKILVGGTFTMIGGGGTGNTARNRIARLNSDGTVDSFDPGADLAVYSIAVQSDGRIVVGGAFTTIGGGGAGNTARFRLARLEANGAVDGLFNPNVGSLFVSSVIAQPDGGTLVSGNFSTIGGFGRSNIGRIAPDGTLDGSFNPGTNGPVPTMALQADGKILLGGVFSFVGGGGTGSTPRRSLARLNADGTVDPTFDPGTNDTVFALAVQPDGRVLVGGQFTGIGGSVGTTARTNFARLLNGAATESLTTSAGTITWLRGGATTEIGRPDFSYSIDGVSFTDLGTVARVAGGWQVTGAALPADPNLRIRVRGVAQGGFQGGSTWSVVTQAPASGVDMIENGGFTAGLSPWQTFAIPDPTGMTSNLTGGVFQFYRTGSQAVVFQQTGLPLPAGAPLEATFQIGNTDGVRKRISVLVHDSNFADLSVCTFWVPAGTPLTGYTLRTHTTQPWTNATISFYAASVNGGGNTTFYQVDNVSLRYLPANTATETTCVDPFAPVPPGGSSSANLITNGDFSTGLAPWTLFGQITGAVNNGVFEFVKNAGTPSGVVLQATNQAMASGQILTATFQLGNSSAVRKRVTVILHDNDFSDLSACTFWLSPGQALDTYTLRTYTTKAWSNATLSVYPATTGAAQWMRLDTVAMTRTPAASLTGTHCIEPGGAVPDQMGPPRQGAGWRPIASGFGGDAVARDTTVRGEEGQVIEIDPSLPGGDDRTWVLTGDAPGRQVLEFVFPADSVDLPAATLGARSWLSAVHSRAEIQVSRGDGVWETVLVVAPSDGWVMVDIDLVLGDGLTARHLRFVLDTTDTVEPGNADLWRIAFPAAGEPRDAP